MSGITFSGLASGMNTASIVSQLMAVERQPETLMQAQQQKNTSKIAKFQKIEDAMSALQTVVQGFNTPKTFSAMKASVVDSTVLSATVASAATPGTHTVQVLALAQSQRQVSTGVASDTALSFSTGTFTIDGGAAITIGAGQNSLQGVVAAINASGAKVTASVINDGSVNGYRLVINGTDTTDHSFDFTGMVSAPTLIGPPDPSYQAASKAHIVVDGVDMLKASNTVTDAIQGVTLNLAKDGGATTNITVTTDTAGVTDKINNFVSAYNRVTSLVNAESAYDPNTKKAGLLSGDATVRMIQTQLQSMLTTVSGATGSFNTLASLGLNADSKTGLLSADPSKLSDALTNHYNDVVDLFAHNGDSIVTLPANQYGIAQQINMSMNLYLAPYLGDGLTTNGILEVVKKQLTDTNAGIDSQISSMEVRYAQMQTNLQNQFKAMETMVSNLQAQGNQLLSYLGASSNSNKSGS